MLGGQADVVKQLRIKFVFKWCNSILVQKFKVSFIGQSHLELLLVHAASPLLVFIFSSHLLISSLDVCLHEQDVLLLFYS